MGSVTLKAVSGLISLESMLACPSCGGSGVFADSGFECQSCGESYLYTDDSRQQLDLRPHMPKCQVSVLEVGDGDMLAQAKTFPYTELTGHDSPEVNFDGIAVPCHLSPPLMSHIPRARHDSSYVLDLGCGDQPHRQVCLRAGFKYIGLDYKSPSAPILGDAHALPFKDETIDFVLSIAVLEHLQFPFIAMREVSRVLRPGGRIIGTVAFSEPFHGDSFYHHTHLGAYNVLSSSGLMPQLVAPDRFWAAPEAHAKMGAYGFSARLALRLAAALDRLEFRVRRSLGKDTRFWQMRCHTGAFVFIAVKPDRA